MAQILLFTLQVVFCFGVHFFKATRSSASCSQKNDATAPDPSHIDSGKVAVSQE